MKSRSLFVTTAVAVGCMLVGLGPAPARADGTIAGTIKLDGPAPQRRTIPMAADPKCVEANPNGRQGDVFVVAPEGGMANVFVYVKDGLGDKKFDAPKDPVIINQEGCMYDPHVLGIMVGQTLEFHNDDSTLHNVHALPKNSKQFNSAMPMKGMTIKKRFSAPEIMVHTKCDVHPWMSAYIGVVDNPFYAVSGTDGSYKISGLPAGTYTIEAWQEKLGTKTATVTVTDGGTAKADFSYAMAKK
jgi:plastocyanin